MNFSKIIVGLVASAFIGSAVAQDKLQSAYEKVKSEKEAIAEKKADVKKAKASKFHTVRAKSLNKRYDRDSGRTTQE